MKPRSSSFRASSIVFFGALAALLPAACDTKEPEPSTYFQRTIAPVLTTSCTRTNTGAGCHVADAKGNAFGNLDTTNFEGVDKRRDLLVDYGPYGQPAFLLKNVEPFQIEVQSFDGTKTTFTTDIKHAGGSILDASGGGYQTLRRWIQNGATVNNTGAPPPVVPRQGCNTQIPGAAGFDSSKDPARADFAQFRDKVSPLLSASCGAGNCHGTTSNELYLTCGQSAEQVRWNYFAASDYLGATPEASELLRRPLKAEQGGAFHEGGAIFASSADPGYSVLLDWAKAHGPALSDTTDDAFAFFAHRVQPVLVKKGCMMVQCHSASMFHDYRLRGGSGGSFSLSATRKNHELSLLQVALESDDPNASRMVRKNLYRPDQCGVDGCDKATGIVHRGGPLFEDFGNRAASRAACDEGKFDYENGSLDQIPGYCIVAEWLRRERARLGLAPFSRIAYVKRPVAALPGRAQDFDVYMPGAELHLVDIAVGADGVLAATNDRVVNDGCGIPAAQADVRKPAVSWDGTKIAFAARASASLPLAIYEMKSDGTGCAPLAAVNAGDAQKNGLLVHNFDPAYGPPGPNGSPLVFASTRGNLDGSSYDYQGPQRTPSDPSKPNANLYVLDGDKLRQLTYLLNTERYPSFMADGRVIFSAEKRAPGFYQLALRRVNIDGGDYHPFYAQRGTIGYLEATHPVELADRNFAAIFADPGVPFGGGALAVFNRSIGIDFSDARPGDFLVDPSVIDPAGPQTPEPGFFLRSLHYPDPSAAARPSRPTTGLYTTPSSLPDGRVLVSFGEAADPAGFGGDYDLYVLDPARGTKVKLLGGAGAAEIDAVAVYARGARGVFASALDEPNGHTTILPGRTDADVTVLDARVLAALLFQNTPTGMTLEPLTDFSLFEDLPPPNDVVSMAGAPAANVASDAFGKVYVRRRLVGRVPLASDGSTRFTVPGGLPMVIELPDTDISRARSLPRVQREQIVFAPGERVHQSFKGEFFNGLCGNCHGAVSGRPLDVALRPDVITRASDTLSRDASPINLNTPPAQRGAIEGAKAPR